MFTKNLPTLELHKLTQAQYDRELEAGRIDEYSLYLVPDEENENNESSNVQYITINGGTTGVLSMEEYRILSDETSYIRYYIEESTNSGRIYPCYLSENTKTMKTYVSGAFSTDNGTSYILIQVNNNCSWYKTQSAYRGYPKPTSSDNGKVLTVFSNGAVAWKYPTLTDEAKEDLANYIISKYIAITAEQSGREQ